MATAESENISLFLDPLKHEIKRAGNLDFRSKQILQQQLITEKQLEIQQPNPTEVFLLKMCNVREHVYWKRICKSCKKDFEHDKKGEPIIYKDFCGSPYCKDNECYTSRIGLAKLILKSYFYVFKTWRENRQRWLHLIFGQKRISKITPTTLKDFRKRVMKVLNFLRKKYKNPHMIAILDLAFNGETFFLHFHVAMRIRGYMNEKEINEFSFKNNLKYKRADGFYSRRPKQLINYFAQRLAGKFEHDKNATSWAYADLFSPEEYLNLFYRKKRFLTRGFDSKQVKEIRKKIKEGLLRFEETLSPNYTNNGQQKVCQFCGFKDYERAFLDNPNKAGKPPPDSLEYPEIEMISFRSSSPITYKIHNKISSEKEIKGEISDYELACSRSRDRLDNFYKRYTRWCKQQDGEKIKESDLDLTDHLNLLAFGKC